MTQYGLVVSILLLDPDTACESAVGGSGCWEISILCACIYLFIWTAAELHTTVDKATVCSVRWDYNCVTAVSILICIGLVLTNQCIYLCAIIIANRKIANCVQIWIFTSNFYNNTSAFFKQLKLCFYFGPPVEQLNLYVTIVINISENPLLKIINSNIYMLFSYVNIWSHLLSVYKEFQIGQGRLQHSHRQRHQLQNHKNQTRLLLYNLCFNFLQVQK